MKNYSLEEKSLIKALSQYFELPESVGALFVNRGLKTEKDIAEYLFKEYTLTNPTKLPGLTKAVKRIKEAIDKDEKIIICGDYDVDGMLASSILFLFLKKINANVDIQIPDRVKDGYGLSVAQMIELREVKNADVLISVDNGISAFEPAQKAFELGMDLIITDHHELPSEGLPKAYSIINPKILKEDPDGLKNLCGAGVAFYLVRALNSFIFAEGQRQNLTDFLVLAMIATISDIVPLKKDNRIIVDKGVSLLYETDILGLNYLLDKINFFQYPTASDLSFYLCPILNATARLNQPYKTIELLTDKTLTISETAEELIKINEERKEITLVQSEWAFKLAQEQILKENPPILLLFHPEFHLGILGLLANKVVDQFGKTCFVMSENNGVIKGSGRTTGDTNLKDLVDYCQDVLTGGGHQMAVGFTMDKDNLDKLKSKVNEYYNNRNIFSPEKKIIEWEFIQSEIENLKLIRTLYHMEPFGAANSKPYIKVKGLEYFQEGKKLKGKHIKIIVSKYLEILYFNVSREQMLIYDEWTALGGKFNVIGEIHSNGEKITLQAHHIEKAD